jgi:hypothetical protein
MIEDEIVEEVHETRRRIFEECGNDLEWYIERLKAAEVNGKGRLVTFDEVRKRARATKSEM